LQNPTETSPPNFTAPDDPPPGYEEAQAQAVGIDLDQRLREAAERQRDSDASPWLALQIIRIQDILLKGF
jgi:hypothetical protein